MRHRLRWLSCWPLLAALLLTGAGQNDLAELEVKPGVEAPNVWDDAGCGSGYSLTCYAAPARDAYFPVGFTADAKDRGRRATVFLVRDISVKGDALAKPTGYKRIWWTRGSGATRDGSIWMPQAPEGYVAVGFVVTASFREPPLSAIRCVRKDLTVPGTADLTGPEALAGAVYKDFGTRAFEDLSVWRVEAEKGFDVGAVFACTTRSQPKAADGVRLLRKSRVRVSK